MFEIYSVLILFWYVLFKPRKQLDNVWALIVQPTNFWANKHLCMDLIMFAWPSHQSFQVGPCYPVFESQGQQ